MKDIIDLISRILIAIIFLYEAYDSIAFFKDTKALMTEFGLTWRQDLLLIAAITLLIFGATLVLLGYQTTIGATMLLLYLVPVTFIVHSFWNDPPEIARGEAISFMKNLAIIGGLLSVWVNDSGKYSVRRLLAGSKVPTGARG